MSDVAGYSRLAGADEDRTLAPLRTLRSDLIDPIISVHHGRVVKRTGDGSIIGFRSGRRSPLRGRNSDQYGRLSGLDGGGRSLAKLVSAVEFPVYQGNCKIFFDS